MILKVIVCALAENRIERRNAGYPDHNQLIRCNNDHFVMWGKMMEYELNEEAGMEMDTLIVCNGKCRNFFDKYNGMETKNGKIIVRYRDNIGGSFGGYSYAYENFNYDYYIFVEDDLIILGKDYLKAFMDWFNRDKETGLLALVGISSGYVYPQHAHGGVGLVPRYVLDKVAKNGKLPYYDGEWNRPKAIRDGEVALSVRIKEEGYKICYYGLERWHKDNYIMPYFDLCI